MLCDWRQSYCDIRKGGWFALQFLMKNENLVMKIHFEDIFPEKNTWIRGFQEIYLTRQVTEPGAFHISPLCHKFRCIISKCLFSKKNNVLITPRTEFYIRNTDFPFGILLFGLHLIRIQIQPDFHSVHESCYKNTMSVNYEAKQFDNNIWTAYFKMPTDRLLLIKCRVIYLLHGWCEWWWWCCCNNNIGTE